MGGRSGIVLAWLIGEGIIVWRSVGRDKRPPVPGALLVSSGLFALLAVIAEYPPAAAPAALFAFGIDLAALMNAPIVGGPNLAATPKTASGGQAHVAVPQGGPGT